MVKENIYVLNGALPIRQLIRLIRQAVSGDRQCWRSSAELALFRVDHDVDRAHFAEEFQLEHLANDLHLSKCYASRVFRRETESTIRDYVIALPDEGSVPHLASQAILFGK